VVEYRARSISWLADYRRIGTILICLSSSTVLVTGFGSQAYRREYLLALGRL
jgi:hypothetical protein